MRIVVPLAPTSANKKPSKRFMNAIADVQFPLGDIRVDIVVFTTRRNGDIDNVIKPVLNALEARGLDQHKVVYITARFILNETEKTIIDISQWR